MAAVTSLATLRRYGCTGPIKPSFDTTKAFRPHKLKHLVPRVTKFVLPDHYDDGLTVALTRIEGLEVDSSEPIEGLYPIYKDVNPQTDLFVDRNYQRQLTAKDLAQIEQIAKRFNFEKMKALTCFTMPSGRLLVTDGQRTALAAMVRGITKLPAMIYSVPEGEEITRQANSFVGINTERRAIPATELLTALIVSGQPEIVEFANILRAHGIKPREGTTITREYLEPNDTCCISVLQNAFFNTDRDDFLAMCSIISRAQFRPIRREHIWATKIVLGKFGDNQIDYIRLDNAIKSIVDKHAVLEAKENARNSRQRTSISNELANIYLNRYKKRAKALNAK